ncbi:hypothetical protein TRVL_07463 [Trypanosoma vivax]|nr:hypothetical protein TRVL_07463 [Trypanosoma vivax]
MLCFFALRVCVGVLHTPFYSLRCMSASMRPHFHCVAVFCHCPCCAARWQSRTLLSRCSSECVSCKACSLRWLEFWAFCGLQSALFLCVVFVCSGCVRPRCCAMLLSASSVCCRRTVEASCFALSGGACAELYHIHLLWLGIYSYRGYFRLVPSSLVLRESCAVPVELCIDYFRF